MASQRIFQLGLRRAAAPGLRVQPVGRMGQRRYVIASGSHDYLQHRITILILECRLAATEHASQSQASEILAKQRIHRPVSPHLSIYKPQITWYASSLNRITGITLSGSLYLFGIAYLIAPYTGWHMETQSMVATVAAWPAAVKIGLKAFFAAPFFFHSLNGLRHLAWDVGIGFKNQQVIRTGWTVVALTAVGTIYYTFIG
jgi:succinate dehydrogenase (ubiquinone) cytochrome b560 subunit